MAFILKAYEVAVRGFPPVLYDAKSAAQARAKAWRSFSESRGTSFRDFLSLSSIRRVPPPERFGEEITVGGERAYLCLGLHGQYVRFCRDDSDLVLLSHPADIGPALPNRAEAPPSVGSADISPTRGGHHGRKHPGRRPQARPGVGPRGPAVRSERRSRGKRRTGQLSDSMFPLLRQMHDAADDRARAGILLRVPDMALAKYRGPFEAACRRAGFDAGEAFIGIRMAALHAVRDPFGRLPGLVEIHLSQWRERFAAFASGVVRPSANVQEGHHEDVQREPLHRQASNHDAPHGELVEPRTGGATP